MYTHDQWSYCIIFLGIICQYIHHVHQCSTHQAMNFFFLRGAEREIAIVPNVGWTTCMFLIRYMFMDFLSMGFWLMPTLIVLIINVLRLDYYIPIIPHLYECLICDKFCWIAVYTWNPYQRRNHGFFTGNSHGKSLCLYILHGNPSHTYPFFYPISIPCPGSALLPGTVAPGHVQGLENNAGAPGANMLGFIDVVQYRSGSINLYMGHE